MTAETTQIPSQNWITATWVVALIAAALVLINLAFAMFTYRDLQGAGIGWEDLRITPWNLIDAFILISCSIGIIRRSVKFGLVLVIYQSLNLLLGSYRFAIETRSFWPLLFGVAVLCIYIQGLRVMKFERRSALSHLSATDTEARMSKSGPASTAAPFALTLLIALSLNWGHRYVMASKYGPISYLYDPDIGFLLSNVAALVIANIVALVVIFLSSCAGARFANRDLRVRPLVMVVLAIFHGLVFWLLNPLIEGDLWLAIYGVAFVSAGPFALAYSATVLWSAPRTAA